MEKIYFRLIFVALFIGIVGGIFLPIKKKPLINKPTTQENPEKEIKEKETWLKKIEKSWDKEFERLKKENIDEEFDDPTKRMIDIYVSIMQETNLMKYTDGKDLWKSKVIERNKEVIMKVAIDMDMYLLIENNKYCEKLNRKEYKEFITFYNQYKKRLDVKIQEMKDSTEKYVNEKLEEGL